jgi:hypothetical protein
MTKLTLQNNEMLINSMLAFLRIPKFGHGSVYTEPYRPSSSAETSPMRSMWEMPNRVESHGALIPFK